MKLEYLESELESYLNFIHKSICEIRQKKCYDVDVKVYMPEYLIFVLKIYNQEKTTMYFASEMIFGQKIVQGYENKIVVAYNHFDTEQSIKFELELNK